MGADPCLDPTKVHLLLAPVRRGGADVARRRQNRICFARVPTVHRIPVATRMTGSKDDGPDPPLPSVPVIPIRPSLERMRFIGFTFTRAKSGQCSAEVVLEFQGKSHAGRAIGASSPLGDLRTSAEACLRALEDCTPEAQSFEI